MARRTRRPCLLLVLAPLLLTACASGSNGVADQGFVSGDGTITRTANGDRGDPVEFRGHTLQGRPLDSADLRGDVVVVNVWGSWCGPCVAEAPALERAWQELRSDPVRFVGVNTRDQRAAALAHDRRFHVTYPSIGDDGGRVLLAFRGQLPPTAIPSTLVLDRRGRVAARVIGQVDTATLRGIVSDVLQERPAA
jgi:thiol-disulfide isomerase/thioredoxin